jgi:hypothetical protein
MSQYDGNPNRHTEDLVEHTGLLFRKVAFSGYGLLSEMFQTDRIKLSAGYITLNFSLVLRLQRVD